MQIKATHHVALLTRNFAEMEKLYTETLGLRVTRRWDDVSIIFINVGSTTIELIGRDQAPEPGSKPGAFDHLAFHVADIDAAYQELVAKGVRIRSEPRDFKEVRVCFFFDPDGNVLELAEDPRQSAHP
jgi:catechol 2,3-dioxygenase-like lactoylglutathione lyase family enzyme